MTEINYVIAAWTGVRRKGNDLYKKDKTYYIREHLRLLKKYDHNLSQITIVAPYNEQEPKNVTNYLESLRNSQIRKTRVVLMRRENQGHSYGSYSHVYGTYREAFDYYIFNEDDYAFTQNNFDSILVNLFDDKIECGFLCGLVLPWEDKPHAAISNGISSQKSLETVWKLKGSLPSGSVTTSYQCSPQLNFSWGFLDAGLQLCDFISDYNVIFNNVGTPVKYGSNAKNLNIALQFKSLYPELS